MIHTWRICKAIVNLLLIFIFMSHQNTLIRQLIQIFLSSWKYLIKCANQELRGIINCFSPLKLFKESYTIKTLTAIFNIGDCFKKVDQCWFEKLYLEQNYTYGRYKKIVLSLNWSILFWLIRTLASNSILSFLYYYWIDLLSNFTSRFLRYLSNLLIDLICAYVINIKNLIEVPLIS